MLVLLLLLFSAVPAGFEVHEETIRVCESARNTGAGECVCVCVRVETNPVLVKTLRRLTPRHPNSAVSVFLKVKPLSSSLAALPHKPQQHLAASCQVMAAVDYQTPWKAAGCRPEAQRCSHFETCLHDRRRD